MVYCHNPAHTSIPRCVFYIPKTETDREIKFTPITHINTVFFSVYNSENCYPLRFSLSFFQALGQLVGLSSIGFTCYQPLHTGALYLDHRQFRNHSTEQQQQYKMLLEFINETQRALMIQNPCVYPPDRFLVKTCIITHCISFPVRQLSSSHLVPLPPSPLCLSTFCFLNCYFPLAHFSWSHRMHYTWLFTFLLSLLTSQSC